MTKDDIRKVIRAEREQRPEAWVSAHSAEVQKQLLALPAFPACNAVATYLNFGAEVATAAIVAGCREAGRAVFVPAYDTDIARYRLCRMDEGVTLRPGRWGILEPVGPDWVGDEVQIDCMVVPGVAFDYAGGRVGHGCGYYDRMALEPCVRGAWRAGLAFDFQVFDHVPTTAHDVPMDVVVTESRVYNREGK